MGFNFGKVFKDAGNAINNTVINPIIGNVVDPVINGVADLFKLSPPPRQPGKDWLPEPDPNAPPRPPPLQPDITNIINDIRIQFNKFLSEKAIYANTQITQVNNIFNKLSVNTLADVSNLVQDIHNENTLIQNQIDYNTPRINRSNIVTWENQQPEVNSLKYQNFYLYLLFYVLVLILGTVMFYMNNTSFIFQVIVFHVLLVYPFLVYYLELFLYIFYAYSYSYLYGVPYDSVYIVNNEIKLM
jgi:hypothetical protein